MSAQRCSDGSGFARGQMGARFALYFRFSCKRARARSAATSSSRTPSTWRWRSVPQAPGRCRQTTRRQPCLRKGRSHDASQHRYRSLVTVERFSASEPGAWSNSYLISDDGEALLFDVFQLRSDAKKLADAVEASGKKLSKVWISHAHRITSSGSTSSSIDSPSSRCSRPPMCSKT